MSAAPENFSNGNLMRYRLDQIEKRVGRIEMMMLGILILFASVALKYLFTSAGLPLP